MLRRETMYEDDRDLTASDKAQEKDTPANQENTPGATENSKDAEKN
jgi:hypothetical protein